MPGYARHVQWEKGKHRMFVKVNCKTDCTINFVEGFLDAARSVIVSVNGTWIRSGMQDNASQGDGKMWNRKLLRTASVAEPCFQRAIDQDRGSRNWEAGRNDSHPQHELFSPLMHHDYTVHHLHNALQQLPMASYRTHQPCNLQT